MKSTRYPGVYAYEVRSGTPRGLHLRDARGRKSFKRGFASPLAASKAKAALDVRARAGELVVRQRVAVRRRPSEANAERRRSAKVHAGGDLANNDCGDDPIDDQAERRPPSRVGDEVGSVL